MKSKTALGVILLFITAFIWGLAFVAQSVGIDKIGCFTFSALRMLLGGIAILPVVLIKMGLDFKKSENKDMVKKTYRTSLIRGMVLGVIFAIACNFQQFALAYSQAGKVSFITAMYMLFVPVICLILRQRVSVINWLAVGLGVVGIFFLCIDFNSFNGINTGDLLALCCAIFFAVHIVMIDRFSADTDGLALSCVQTLTGGIISLVPMLIFELPVSW